MGDNECKVSIVIPTYGRPDCLSRAVESVLNQTYKNIEIIVVDDNEPGSANRIATEKTMKDYSKLSNMIYLKHEHNMNGAAARNTGIGIASGKYISFLDDDDEMLPNRIELLVEKMEHLDNSWGACYSDFIKLKSGGKKDRCGEKRTGELYLEALMRSLYFCPGSNLFARAEFVKEIGGFDTDFKRNQDMEFLTRLLEKCKLAFIDEITLIIHYEKRTGVKMNYSDMKQLDEFYLNKFKEKIDKLNPLQRKKIYQYFALERFRYSIKMREMKDGLNNCKKNEIGLRLFSRYLLYMLYRLVTKKSVGFRI